MIVLVTLAACARSAYVTPVAVLPSRPPSCRVTIADAPLPGTKVLALVHCSDGPLSAGTSCAELVRQRACEVGGDVIFGAHWEGDFDMVVTVGAEPSPTSTDGLKPAVASDVTWVTPQPALTASGPMPCMSPPVAIEPPSTRTTGPRAVKSTLPPLPAADVSPPTAPAPAGSSTLPAPSGGRFPFPGAFPVRPLTR